jgi:hypothetical protein
LDQNVKNKHIINKKALHGQCFFMPVGLIVLLNFLLERVQMIALLILTLDVKFKLSSMVLKGS